uniref:Peptidase C14 caspase domain-containing protein n=1 Tax=viral metagenome TaxID=1070528 RepID=A0A6C0EWS2_9ZZZZ
MKRALLVGINYLGTSNQLNGCINDINNIGTYLYTVRKYNSFIVLTDYTAQKPTRANILSAFAVLLKDVVAGDELWFHYSGHGALMRDTSGDEESRQDSCICPLDFARSGFITDDLIRNNLALLVPKGVRLYIILDACHSGTGCDLRYKYDDSSYLTNKKAPLPSTYVTADWSLQQTNYEYKRYAKTNGDVFCISGCQDSQTSADAYIDGQAAGALSYILLTCLRNNSPTIYKWKHLLKDICCGEKVNRFEQRTAITSGNPLNMEDNVFITMPTPAAAAPAPARIANNMGKKQVISMARNLNYNPKINKLYIKF